MNDMNLRPRRPNVARILSWISPGLGQIYCGRFEAGLIIFMVTMSMLSLAPASLLLPGHLCQVGWFVLIACLALWWYAGFDAARTARKLSEHYLLKDYNRASVYILFSLMALPVALGLAIFVRSTMLAPYYVASDSMVPTIQKGQRILVSKLIYRDEPMDRGDIVVFLNPNRRYETDVKRLIALPDDRVEIRNGNLLVNGKP
ncbi:MAG TPA: signal peptidase I, partial [Tepidisphaeraceae bacterium]|nr:signal peptidase I [Tepidisphaeraceae bacterium]